MNPTIHEAVEGRCVVPFNHPDPHIRMGQTLARARARAATAHDRDADELHKIQLLDDALQYARTRDTYFAEAQAFLREERAARRGRALSRLLIACATIAFALLAGAMITKALANSIATVAQAEAMEW